MDAVRTKLTEIENRYDEISSEMLKEEVYSNPSKLTRLSKEQASLKQAVDAWHQLKSLDERIEQADEMLHENDEELREMAKMEKEECEPEREKLLERIQHLLIPRDPDDDHDVIMEIRGGAGGDEGNIFAGDLYRMYTKYAEAKGWKVQVMEASVSDLLTEINMAVARGEKKLTLSRLNMSASAKESLIRLWTNDNFRCPEEEIVEKCLTTSNGFQVRGIPLLKIDPSAEENYQEAVINFNKNGQIISFYYTINPELYTHLMMDIMKGGGKKNEITDINRRMQIIDYVEQFRTSYNQKDLKFLNQVFSDDALIITGSVIKVKKSEVMPSDRVVRYSVKTKREYLTNLANAFRNNQYINVAFDDITIVHHPTKRDVYGVTVRQRWNSSRYSDEGYVFMVWDFTDEKQPKIHVRTWQPEYLDKASGRKLPQNEVFTMKDFDLE